MMGESLGSKELPGEGGVRKAERRYIGSSGWEKVSFFLNKKMSRGEQVSVGAADNEMLSYSKGLFNWSWREGIIVSCNTGGLRGGVTLSR